MSINVHQHWYTRGQDALDVAAPWLWLAFLVIVLLIAASLLVLIVALIRHAWLEDTARFYEDADPEEVSTDV